MPQFIYLLHDTPGFFSKLSPQEIQAVIEKYKKWGQSMREKNRLVGGQKLEDTTGRVLRGQTMTDGPYAESKEVIGGYYIVEAKDYEEAVSLAKTCPHIQYGTIEVRKIDVV